MQPKIHIRPARKEDCPRMLELIHELAIFEKAPNEVKVSLEHFVSSGFGEKPVWWGFVAETEHPQVIGMAICYVRYSTWKGQSVYLEDLIVTESYRRQGIGKLLFNTVKEDAKRKGFKTMNWQVLDWNAPAIGFYDTYRTSYSREWLNCSLTF